MDLVGQLRAPGAHWIGTWLWALWKTSVACARDRTTIPRLSSQYGLSCPVSCRTATCSAHPVDRRGVQEVLLMWLTGWLCVRRHCGGRRAGQGCGRKRLWRNLRYYSSICLEGLRTTTTNQKRRTGVPTMGPWCRLFCCDCWRELLKDGLVTGTAYWSSRAAREISDYFEH